MFIKILGYDIKMGEWVDVIVNINYILSIKKLEGNEYMPDYYVIKTVDNLKYRVHFQDYEKHVKNVVEKHIINSDENSK